MDLETLCLSEDLKKHIMNDIVMVSKENGVIFVCFLYFLSLFLIFCLKLNGFEIPRAIYLEPVPFDVERDIVTPTLKLKRPKAKEIYQKQIEEMYQSVVE